MLCGYREYLYFLCGRTLKIPRGWGVFKAELLEEKYEAKLEFPGGTRVQNKKPSVVAGGGGGWGEYGYFLELHNNKIKVN